MPAGRVKGAEGFGLFGCSGMTHKNNGRLKGRDVGMGAARVAVWRADAEALGAFTCSGLV